MFKFQIRKSENPPGHLRRQEESSVATTEADSHRNETGLDRPSQIDDNDRSGVPSKSDITAERERLLQRFRQAVKRAKLLE